MKQCEIRNNPGMSSYFGEAFQGYGRYQWNIKYYAFESEYEIETARQWAFGEHVKVGINPVNGNTLYGFDYLNEVIGRKVQTGIDGRSGGWLVIDTELSDAELKLVDEHVKACMQGLETFLKDEREFRRSENE